MVQRLRTASVLLAPFDSVARRATLGVRAFVVGTSLLPCFSVALQLGCSVDERHPQTAEDGIEASGGTTATASNPSMTPLPSVASGGSSGADLGKGGAANPSEMLPAPPLVVASDAGGTSPTLTEPPPDAAGTAVTPPDPPALAACDTSLPFQSPVLIPGLSSAGDEYGIWLTADELTAYFSSNRRDLGGPGDYDIYRAKRTTIADAFGQPSLVPLVNSGFSERKAVVSADGLRLFFSSDRPGLGTGDDIYVSVRPNPSSEFGAPGLLSGINSNQGDLVHSITSDGRSLYFDRPVAGAGRDIFLFDLSNTSPTSAVTELESPYEDGHALASADGLTVYWATTRVSLAESDGSAQSDIWSARRASPNDPLGNLAPVAELNTASAETVHYLSADGCRIYIGSERSGSGQLYVAARP